MCVLTSSSIHVCCSPSPHGRVLDKKVVLYAIIRTTGEIGVLKYIGLGVYLLYLKCLAAVKQSTCPAQPASKQLETKYQNPRPS